MTLLLPAPQSFLNASYHLVYYSFWNLIPFSLPTRPVSTLDSLHAPDQILFLSQSISDRFNKLRPGSWTILATMDFSKAFNSVWHPTLFHKLISAGLRPCFACWTQSFFSDKHTWVVYQNQKVVSVKSVEVFCKDLSQGLFFDLYFFFFSSMISLLLCFFPSAALFMLMIWLGSPAPWYLLQCLSSYRLLAPLALWRLYLFTTSSPGPGELPGFWGSMVSHHAPIP